MAHISYCSEEWEALYPLGTKLSEILCCSECLQVHVVYVCEIDCDFHKLVHDRSVPRWFSFYNLPIGDER